MCYDCGSEGIKNNKYENRVISPTWNKILLHNNFITVSDKQQELDLPSLRIDDVESRSTKKKEKIRHGPNTMSQISGVKKPLCHTNSFTGEKVPTYGVDTHYEEELGKVSCKLSQCRRDVLLRVVYFSLADFYGNRQVGNWHIPNRRAFKQ